MLRFAKLAMAFLFATMFYTGVANAQATRTWVSGVGDDVNPCSRTAPCKTFAGAISKTAAGGEINCLDPAGFGAVTITKSITIDCTQTVGGVLSASTTGVIVNGANVDVVLRGLLINGGPPTSPGLFGVRFLQGTSLTIEQSFIQNAAAASPNGIGIQFVPTTAANLTVSNTTILNNGVNNVSGGGINVNPSGAAGSARVLLNNVQVVGNGTFGLALNTTGNTGGGIIATVTNSQFNNNQNGITVTSAAGTSNSVVIISNATIVNNSATGVLVTGLASSARISNSVIVSNGTGIQGVSSGFLRSVGGNLLDANTVNGTFTDTIPKV